MEARELRSVIEAAARAAAVGDHASAEQLLHEAASVQEANLGPLDPGLANILNNLGVVCEVAGKPADAERWYRQAYSIATAALEPDHPFVATSRKNLSDFCEARGIPVELPLPPSVEAAMEPPAPHPVQAPHQRSSHAELSQPARASVSRLLALGAVTAGVLLFAVFMTLRPKVSSPERSGVFPEETVESRGPVESERSVESGSQTAAPTPSTAAEPVNVEPIPAPKDEPSPAPNETTIAELMPSATMTPAPASPPVAEALLCTNLSTLDWQCDRASSPVRQGSLFFYTRVKSDNDTTVQHRWYRGDRLEQAVELRIRANPESGFRTYSRRTVDNRSAGNWRVELRAADGSILHEERFVVQ